MRLRSTSSTIEVGKFTEKRLEEDRLFAEMEKAVEEAGKPDSEIMEQWRILINPNLPQGFYNIQYPYLPEFGQAYRIFEEEGARENPIQIANTIVALESYKVASKHDPNQPHRHFKGSIEGKRGNHLYTNKQFLERIFHWLVNTITFEGNLMPGKTLLSPEQANRKGKRF